MYCMLVFGIPKEFKIGIDLKKHKNYFTKVHKENAKIHRDFLSPIQTKN